MATTICTRIDGDGYDKHYDLNRPWFDGITSLDEFIYRYETSRISPFHCGGITKGSVYGLAIRRLLEWIQSDSLQDITILDAGCGQGDLSIYLAARGFTVHGIDISPVACDQARQYAELLGASQRLTFNKASLEEIPLPDSSVDFVIGHGALHHFIKYEGVPREMARVLKSGGRGFFADAWGENPIYALFHDREVMNRLGDVRLTKAKVEAFFSPEFDVSFTPADWFTMFDKLWEQKLARGRRMPTAIARTERRLDDHIRVSSRLALRLAGAVVTEIGLVDSR